MLKFEAMKLPVAYSAIAPQWKRKVREEYAVRQGGKCYWCNESLLKEAPKKITDLTIKWNLFPSGFMDYPVHLQHNHDTDMTEGAVHNYCNAVMWQYHHR